MVKPLPVAHLHDFGFEVAQGRVGTAVLATGFCVGWPVHVGQERHFLNPQAVNDDMHMDIAAVVMPVRVSAYKGLVKRTPHIRMFLFVTLLASTLNL